MPEDKLVEYVEGMRTKLAHAVAAMPTHEEWIDRYWKTPAR
jgi:tryptophan halogenase